jgi:hypothetical protein
MRAWHWMSRFRHVGGTGRQIRLFITLRCYSEGRKTRKAADATLPRKASKEICKYPYRKPTQVGEEKILRRK